MPFQHAIADVLHGERAQRGLRRGFPHGDIAADGRQECVPGPDRHRKIKRRNHAHHAERVPLLVHAVLRPFRVHGVAVQHARLPDREIGDVDHLLDLAVALRFDLAVLQGHQTAQQILGERSSTPMSRTASPRSAPAHAAKHARRKLPQAMTRS